MPTIFEDLRATDYASNIPQEMVDDILERRHLFEDLQNKMNNFDEDVAENNNLAVLRSSIFQVHPQIPKGYYTHKSNGVYFVKDVEGKSIRKDKSYLLIDGTFVDQDAVTVMSLNSSSFNNYYLQYEKDELPLNFFDDKILKINNGRSSFYTKFDIDKVKKVYNFNTVVTAVTSLLGRHTSLTSLIDFLTSTNLKTLLENSSNVRTYLDSHINFVYDVDRLSSRSRFKTETYQVSDEDSIFHDCYLSFYDMDLVDVSVATLVDNMRNGRTDTIPTIIFSDDRQGFGEVPNFAFPNSRNAYLFSNLEPLPFSLCQGFPFNISWYVHIANTTTDIGQGTNRQTRNNEGFMLNYSAKVEEKKRSFMLTESEASVYKRLTKSLEKEKNTYRRKRQEILMSRHSVESSEEFQRQSEKLSKIKPPTLKPTQNPLFLGVEIEVVPKPDFRDEESQRSIIAEMSNSSFGDHMIIKSDSSIGAYGFEIVTIPASLEYHKQVFEKDFFGNDLHKKVMATNSCGIHVHLSRNYFTNLSLGKFIAFLNKSSNREFVEQMANRPNGEYCRRMPVKQKTSSDTIDKSASVGRKLNLQGDNSHIFDRRHAVNVTNNSQTVEVRIFKATNTKNNLLRKMEFCDALARFVHNVSAQQLTAHHFVEFILRKENKKQYPFLTRWLSSKNYIDHEKKKILGRNKLVHIYKTNKVPVPENQYTNKTPLQTNLI